MHLPPKYFVADCRLESDISILFDDADIDDGEEAEEDDAEDEDDIDFRCCSVIAITISPHSN